MSQNYIIVPQDTSNVIEEIYIDTEDNGALISFKSGGDYGFGVIKRKKIIVSLGLKAEYIIQDNFDGTFNLKDKKFLLNIHDLYSNYPIPDSNVVIEGESVSSQYLDNVLSFDSNDSIIYIKCLGYYDLAVTLPTERKAFGPLLISAKLQPKIKGIRDGRMEFSYNKKMGVAINNGVKYDVYYELIDKKEVK